MAVLEDRVDVPAAHINVDIFEMMESKPWVRRAFVQGCIDQRNKTRASTKKPRIYRRYWTKAAYEAGRQAAREGRVTFLD